MLSERVQRRIDRLLDQAEEAADARDWTAVLESVGGVLNVDEANEDALHFQRIAEGALAATAVPTSTSAEVALPAEVQPASNNDQPTSFASGRYTVSKFLGEGGKKKVYLAHDNTLDRDIAFALIKTEGLDETSRERVKREAQAMGRMGTHPSIMPIYDLGSESGQPFMVQPLMGGGDVEGLIEGAEGPLELERALEIATQTAQGLSFAHSKGIVHRDLKPGNVWLDEDGAAKIGDFGLAVATDRSRLTVEKVIVGTVSYMPPEQATGGEVTPRADLYSLGAMLYEMCTGRVPFMGDDDIGIISQHINTPPVAPSWHNSQIPKTLDSLILRLLAKDPSERPSDADEVLAVLEDVDLSAVEEREEGSKGSLDSMAGGVFVGRHREMDQLKSIFEEVLSGKGRMVTIIGEPGIGKTRTAQELATYAGMRGAGVLWGRSYESGGAPPYWPWVQALRSHVASTEPDDLRRQLGATAPVISEIVSEVKAVLPDIESPSVIEDPESARFRLFDSISTFLKQVSSVTPLVLMLEDLHWSDKPSLILLEFVARELANSRILIVGNYRDMELNRRHPLSVTLGDLSRERLFERVVLRGLQRHDVERFIEIAAGITPPAALVDTVHSQTEGNPLFVTETVRLLVQEGDISSGRLTQGGTTSWEIRIPEGVREVIGRRLDRLSERCNEVLTIAAVIGRQFRFDVVKMLVEDTTEGQLLDAMDEALSARLIEEIPTEVGFYQFTHASMQETLTGELSLTRRVTVHARVAEALEKLYANELATHAETLAYHFEQSQTIHGTEKMVKYSVMAGESALSALGYDEALVHFRRAHEPRKDDEIDEELAEILYGLARAELSILSGVEDQERGIGRLVQAFDFYRSIDDPVRAGEMASATFQGIAIKNSLILTKKAMAYLDPESREASLPWSRRGLQMMIEGGNLEEALKTAQHGVDIAEREDMIAAQAWGHYRLSVIHFSMSDARTAIKSGVTALAGATRAGDNRAALLANSILFVCHAALGNRDLAEQHHDSAADLARISRDRTRQSQVAAIGLPFWLASGQYGHSDFALEVADEDIGSPFYHAYAAWAAAEQGRDEDAKNGFDKALSAAIRRFEQGATVGMGGPGGLTPLIVGSGIRAGMDLNESEIQKLASRDPNDRGIVTALSSVMLGDNALATSSYAELVQLRGMALNGVSTDTILGLQSVLMEDVDQASEHFEDAIQFCEKAGYRAEQAWAQFHYAETLQDADIQPEKVTELQDNALATAAGLGMKLLTRRVLAKREA